jgi:hypothetical protein
MRNKMFEPTPEMHELLRRSGSLNKSESLAATAELAKALQLPLRQGVLVGDILGTIFESVQMAPGATTESREIMCKFQRTIFVLLLIGF